LIESDRYGGEGTGLTGSLRIDSFNGEGLVHGFFNRHGGVSDFPYATLNISFGVGDRVEAVRENRMRLKNALGLTSLISARQVHGDKVLVIDKDADRDFEADGYDALVTKNRQTGLLIQQADCQAVIFYDPAHRVIAAAHSGWRGNVAGIIGKTVRAMADNFGTDPTTVMAAISPSLGPCCAEFINYQGELPEWMHRFQIRPSYFDFWAISRSQLEEAGLVPANIAVAGICTRCNEDYFSFRRNAVTGRCGTVIGLPD